jgi:hypothetical protein
MPEWLEGSRNSGVDPGSTPFHPSLPLNYKINHPLQLSGHPLSLDPNLWSPLLCHIPLSSNLGDGPSESLAKCMSQRATEHEADVQCKAGTVAHCHPSYTEAEVGGLWTEASLGQNHETLSEK